MDFKGITWAGNIYQKFEAMCLEVEEAMYQDTVKYVENQVQKVGVSVKKFYSEVIEDLSPPSCVDPISSPSGYFSLDPHSDAGVIKKETLSIFDSHPEKENEDQVITNVIGKKESSVSGNYDINSLFPRNKCPDSRAVTSKRLGIHRRAIGIKRIPKNNHPSKDSCRIMSASDDVNAMSSGELEVSCKASPVSVTSVGSTASEKILSAESSRLNEDDSGCVSPASGKDLSAESVRENKNGLSTFIPAFENNLSGASSRLNEDDSSCVSPASGKELSAESARENKNDLDAFTPAFENNLSAESLRLNEDYSGCVSPSSGKEVSAESVRKKKNDLDTFIPAFENNLSAESLRLNEDDFGSVFPASGKDSSVGSVRKNNSDSDTFMPASENNLSAESERLKGDPESTSSCSVLLTESTGTTKNSTSFSENITTKNLNLESQKELMVSNEGTSMKEGSSSVGTTSYMVEPWKKEIVLPNDDSSNMEVIDNEEKNLKPVERPNLEESCIVVEGDEIDCIPHDSRKHKSYKKKIREALSSKLKLMRDHKSFGGKINGEAMIRVHSMDTEKMELTAYDSLESD